VSRELPAPAASSQRTSFTLAKLYADCVSPAGDVAIVYAGNVSWRSLRLSLSGVTRFDRDGRGSDSWSLSGGSVTHEGRELHWHHGDSSFDAASSVDGFHATLFATEAGSVAFDCFVPDGAATVTHRGTTLEGRGYAERLELTIPPWELPIDSLRWGRFTGGDESLVWIEWRGAHPLSRVFRHGAAVDGAAIRSDLIELPDSTRLTLGEPRVLRSGPLGGLRGAVSDLVAQLPAIARFHETKWVRAGRLERNGIVVSEGWVIDEDVRLR